MQAYFLNHCDEPGCDLGEFQYTCPSCQKTTIDYEIWWEEDNVWKGSVVDFNCEKCEAPLQLSYDNTEYEFNVKLIQA